MIYLKTFEGKKLDENRQKRVISSEIFNILDAIDFDKSEEDENNIYINTIILAFNKYNKIKSIKPVIFSNNLKEVYVELVTLKKGINSVFREITEVCSIEQMLQVLQYLKDKYPEEYKRSLLNKDIKKYNL